MTAARAGKRSRRLVELTAVADPSELARSTAAAEGIPWFADFSAMLEEVRPDGVIVATPTDNHLAPALAALESGAHVLVEKPIDATLENAEALRAASEASGRPVLVGYHRRCSPRVRRARDIIADGGIGRIVAVSGQWGVRKHDAYYDPSWRRLRNAGPVLINLVREIDCLRYVCGEIVGVSAETSNFVEGFEKEDVAAFLFRLEGGALGTFILSGRVNSPWSWKFATGENPAFPVSGENAWRIMGTAASLEFPRLALWQHAEPCGNWHFPIGCTEVPAETGDGFDRQIEHFSRIIRGVEEPLVGAADAARTLEAPLAVFESARIGRRISL